MTLRLTALGILLGLASSACTPQKSSREDAHASPTPSHLSDGPSSSPSIDAAPSQTPEEAQRDGIAPQIARLALASRLRIAISPFAPNAEAALDAPEGRWVASHNNALPLSQDECGFQTSHGRQYTCSPEYGELLLLDKNSGTILRAYPLPALPPHHLVIDDQAVYCHGRAMEVFPTRWSVGLIERRWK